MDASLRQSLVNSGLVGSESPPTLEHQGDAFKGRTSFRHCDVRMDLNVHGMLSMARGTKRQRPIQMPTAISVARIARTIATIRAVVMGVAPLRVVPACTCPLLR